MEVIVDTDALLALFNVNDSHHEKARQLATGLLKKRIDSIIIPTTLAEFALLASSRIGVKESQKAVGFLTESNPIPEVTKEITSNAVLRYIKQTSKEESLFDCFNMSVAEKLGIEYIFSFDKGYTKKSNGFRLASELV